MKEWIPIGSERHVSGEELANGNRYRDGSQDWECSGDLIVWEKVKRTEAAETEKRRCKGSLANGF